MKQLDLGLFPRTSVKLVRQSELGDAGFACLAMVADYHRLQIDLGTIRRRFGPSTRGSSIRSLITTADRLGLTPRAVSVEICDLRALALPAVLHWSSNHFVVLERISGRRALIHDPNGRSEWRRLSDLSGTFTGQALELQPSGTYETTAPPSKLRLSQLWSRMHGFKRGLAQAVVLSLILQALSLAAPYYLQLAIDSALPAQNLGFLGVLALGFGLLVLLNGLTGILRSAVLLSVGTSFGFGLSTNVARKLFRLPIDWFARRQVGDILSRFQSVFPIRQMLAEDAPAVLMNGALAVVTLALMFFYSPLLSFVSASALVSYAAVRALLFRPQRSAHEERIVASGKESSILIESLRGMRTVRLNGRETLRHSLWQSRLIELVNGTVRYQRLVNWQAVLNGMVFGLENVIIIWLAVGKVMTGGFSLGMVFAYIAYKDQFLRAGASLIDKASDFGMLGLHLERLSDIALESDDVSFTAPSGYRGDLKGRIELKDIHHRYGADDPFMLRGVDLLVEPGESVAITGPSGGGKTTLVQIILGLIEPVRGEVIIDGLPLKAYGYQHYRQQVAAILQDDTLFAGSIAENISLFDDHIDMKRVMAAAQTASIAGDIEAMPMGYDTLVGDLGSALSGGQRQRVLLARALYREPKVLIMDEGTSHLDAAREREVNRAIAKMGITRIIVAHRRETIASADRVLVLEGGKLRPHGLPTDGELDRAELALSA